MTESEISKVFGWFIAAWPSSHVGTGTPQVWLDNLDDVDSSYHEQAAQSLIQRLSWFPSVADYRKEVEALRRAQGGFSVDSGDREPPADPDTTRKFIGMSRKVLVAQKRGVAHWHGGPHPCPRCKTIPPPYGTVVTEKVEEPF